MENVNLATALALANAGIPIFPAHVMRRGPNGWLKKPAIRDWRTLATTDEAQIQAWWRQFPRAVPGIELEQAGLVVVDPDHHANGPDGEEAFAQLAVDIGGLPEHPTTDTPNGRHHIFAQDGGSFGNSPGGLPPGVDVRGAGGWIVAPGAVRPDGVAYVARQGTPSLAQTYRTRTIPALPEKLAEIIRAVGEASASESGANVLPSFVGEGRRLDVEACLAAMEPNGASVNDVQKRVILSLLQKAMPPDDVIKTVVDATMAMADAAGLGWSREVEVGFVSERVKSGLTLLHKEYDPSTGVIPAWLPGEFHSDWADALTQGRRPQLVRNLGGFYVRAFGGADGSNGPGPDDKKVQAGPAKKPRVVLRPFEPIDPAALAPRQYLYGKHYQRRVVSATVAPGGTGKTSLCMVEAVAMATCRNLLGEQPEERCRVWLHNGEDSRDELLRRVIAICQHYNIPQDELVGWLFLTSGTEMPLKVANGYSDLKIDTVLVQEMTQTVLEHGIDVVMLDPLVTIHSINENDNGKMDAVVRIFGRMTDTCDCAIDLSQHTRKLPPGAVEHSADDARGASAVHDAVRAQRILNVMSAKEAESLQIEDMERRSYFRVDRSKANTAPPAKVAIWRKFESVELANGDNVGVVTPTALGDAAPSEERETAAQKAKDTYLVLLDRFERDGRIVSDKAGKNYAPALFALEPEAKKAKVGKARLEEAQRQLFADRAIKVEDCGKPSRPVRRIMRFL